MQRRISISLCLCLLLTMLAACGASAPGDVGAPPQAPSQPNGNGSTAPGNEPGALSPSTDANKPDTTLRTAPSNSTTANDALMAPSVGGAIAPAPAEDLQPPPAHPGPPVKPGPDEEIYDSMFFQNYGVNPFVSTANDPLSTFAMDIDTASYGVMRRYLSDGSLPDPDSVRVEEYLNYFDYEYPQPEGGDFAIYTEAAPSQFGGAGYELVQIGIQGRSIAAANRKPAALTFVIDVSGSMAREDRLGAVKQALALLVGEMREDDSIAIAVYGDTGRAVLDVTSGADKDRILDAINRLQPEGSTNVEAGLQVGFGLADEGFKEGGINLVLLCSDGVANNGVTDPAALLDKYRNYLDQGIQLSAYGFGMGNYNYILMETLADSGNGGYAYIDTIDEAERVFVQNLSGTLQTIARDAKIQVEFDPTVVKRYRLVGYENRDVADEDFRNDTVDAGEVGAGHSVTALYEIKRFPGAEGNVATVRIRYEKPDGGNVVEEAQSLTTASIRADLTETTPRFKLASAVAQYAELLRHSKWVEGQTVEDVIGLAQRAASGYNNNADVTEFVDLVTRASGLALVRR
jgi:Ca-activated chloride channel family protein